MNANTTEEKRHSKLPTAAKVQPLIALLCFWGAAVIAVGTQLAV